MKNNKYEMVGIRAEKDMLIDFLGRLAIVQKYINNPKHMSEELPTILKPMIDFFKDVVTNFDRFGISMSEEDINKMGFLKEIDLDQ